MVKPPSEFSLTQLARARLRFTGAVYRTSAVEERSSELALLALLEQIFSHLLVRHKHIELNEGEASIAAASENLLGEFGGAKHGGGFGRGKG